MRHLGLWKGNVVSQNFIIESVWYFCTIIFIDNIINVDTLREIFNLVSDPLSFDTSESEDNISG